MEEGPSRATVRPSRRARGIGVAVVAMVAVAVAVLAGALLGSRGATTDPWVRGYESVDAGAVVQDATQIRTDLELSPSRAVAALRYDCEIGRRDAARLQGHLSPANSTLRRAYEELLQRNWRMYAGCTSDLASRVSDVASVRVQLKEQLTVLGHDESRVNAVARGVGYAPVFAGAR
jgi:hypothetical protein